MNDLRCREGAERRNPLFHLLLTLCLAACAAMALELDMNLGSGNNYRNWFVSFGDTPTVTVVFAAVFYARLRADQKLPSLGYGMWLLSLFLGAWWVMAQSVRTTQEINQPFLSSAQMLKALVTTVGMAGLYELLARLLYGALSGEICWEARALRSARIADWYRRHTLLFCAGAVLLMWLPHIVIGYPCTMNNDTAVQVRQAIGLEARVANHPPFGTMLIALALRVGDLLGSYGLGLYMYMLIQCVFAAYVIGYSHAVMRKLGAPLWLRVISLLTCGLMPVYCDNVTVLIKDVPYVYAAVLLLCEMVRAEYLREEGYAARAGHLIRVTLSCVILLNIRNNGLGIVAPVFLVMLWRVFRRRNRRMMLRAIVIAALPFVLTMCIEHTLNSAYEIQPRSPREGLSLPFQQTARFMRDHGDEISPEERAIIGAVLDVEQIGALYDPMLSDPVKATYKEDATAQELLAYFKVWGKQFWRDPQCYIKATLIQNALLFDPQTYNVAIFSDTGLYFSAAEILKISRPHALGKLELMEGNLRDMLFRLPLVPQLNSLGFHCVVLLMAVYIIRRFKVRDMNLLLAPMYIVLIMLVLGPCIEHQDRYGFPIIYSMPLILACISHGMRKNKIA